MSLPRLWTMSQELDPLRLMRREMENAFRAFNQTPSSAGIGAGAPAISVAETNEAFEVTAELPGVDEKDINVSLDDNQLVIKKPFEMSEEFPHNSPELEVGDFRLPPRGGSHQRTLQDARGIQTAQGK